VGWVSVKSSVWAVGFCGPCVWVYSVVVVEGACVRDCRELGLCKVGIVGWSAGDECVGGEWSGDRLGENGRGR
jgi:hypothetical protein